MAANNGESLFDVTHVYCDPPLSAPTIIGGALSLMVALAWNGAAKDLVDVIAPKFDGAKAKLIGAVIYAVLMTIGVLLVIVVYNQVHGRMTRKEVVVEKITNRHHGGEHRPVWGYATETMTTGIGDVSFGGGGRVVPGEYIYPYEPMNNGAGSVRFVKA